MASLGVRDQDARIDSVTERSELSPTEIGYVAPVSLGTGQLTSTGHTIVFFQGQVVSFATSQPGRYDLGFRTTVTSLRSELSRAASLRTDWDGNCAPAPDPTSVANASQVLGLCEAQFCSPERVVPSVEGGVGLYFKRNER